LQTSSLFNRQSIVLTVTATVIKSVFSDLCGITGLIQSFTSPYSEYLMPFEGALCSVFPFGNQLCVLLYLVICSGLLYFFVFLNLV
jgi:hypothetical protein